MPAKTGPANEPLTNLINNLSGKTMVFGALKGTIGSSDRISASPIDGWNRSGRRLPFRISDSTVHRVARASEVLALPRACPRDQYASATKSSDQPTGEIISKHSKIWSVLGSEKNI